MAVVLVSILVVLISIVYFWIRKRFSVLEKHGFQHEKPSFPAGNMKDVGKTKQIAERVQELYKKYKDSSPAFGMYFFINPSVVITDLEMVKNVLVKDFDYFRNRGLYSNPRDDPLTGHLFLIEDQAWKNMRVKLTPTFTSGKMKNMFGTMIDISSHLLESLEKKYPDSSFETDVKDVLAKFTTDVIGNVAFGLDMNSIKDEDSKFRQMGKKLFDPNTTPISRALFLSSFRKIGRKLKLKIIPRELSEFFMDSITQTVDYRIKNNIERNDVMQMLINMMRKGDNEHEKITFNELAAQCFVFFIAGFETSSSTGSFVLYNLATHIDVQNRLRDEITKVLAKHNNELNYDSMQEMKYLHMVIDETLRLYGPVPQLIRKSERDYKLPGTDLTIPANTLTIIPIYAIHHDADIYPEPDTFNPDRMSEEEKHNRHSMAFLAFGNGSRNCIGERFGYMQTKVALIQLLTKYKFSTCPETPVPLKLHPKSFILSTEKKIVLKVDRL